MVGAWHGHGMASVNQTRPHCVNQTGKTYSKPLAARHGSGTAWARHENGMICVNRPLVKGTGVFYTKPYEVTIAREMYGRPFMSSLQTKNLIRGN